MLIFVAHQNYTLIKIFTFRNNISKRNKNIMLSKEDAALKILHAFKWYKQRKQHIINTFKAKLERCQMLLCRLFRGYLFRKAFLANTIIFMDVYLPLSAVGRKDADVFVVCDFTEDPWKDQTKCEYTEFFNAYKAVIPVVDGTQFKFITNGEYIASTLHPTIKDHSTGSINNVVEIYLYISDQNDLNSKRTPLLNSLSLSNPSINRSIFGVIRPEEHKCELQL